MSSVRMTQSRSSQLGSLRNGHFLDCGDVGRGASTTPDLMQPQFHRLVILCTFVENIMASSSATDYVE